MDVFGKTFGNTFGNLIGNSKKLSRNTYDKIHKLGRNAKMVQRLMELYSSEQGQYVKEKLNEIITNRKEGRAPFSLLKNALIPSQISDHETHIQFNPTEDLKKSIGNINTLYEQIPTDTFRSLKEQETRNSIVNFLNAVIKLLNDGAQIEELIKLRDEHHENTTEEMPILDVNPNVNGVLSNKNKNPDQTGGRRKKSNRTVKYRKKHRTRK